MSQNVSTFFSKIVALTLGTINIPFSSNNKMHKLRIERLVNTLGLFDLMRCTLHLIVGWIVGWIVDWMDH